MRLAVCLLLLFCGINAVARDDKMPPLPDIGWGNPEQPGQEGDQCREKKEVSNPVVSYHVSPLCEVTDINAVGGYKFGTGQVMSEVRKFQSNSTVKRFVGGDYHYRQQHRIELHKALKHTDSLVCELDMMGKQVLSARIERTKTLDNGKELPYQDPVKVENGRLPDLGTFTYSKKVTHTTKQCP